MLKNPNLQNFIGSKSRFPVDDIENILRKCWVPAFAGMIKKRRKKE